MVCTKQKVRIKGLLQFNIDPSGVCGSNIQRGGALCGCISVDDVTACFGVDAQVSWLIVIDATPSYLFQPITLSL